MLITFSTYVIQLNSTSGTFLWIPSNSERSMLFLYYLPFSAFVNQSIDVPKECG
jgi:hypothetical protein